MAIDPRVRRARHATLCLASALVAVLLGASTAAAAEPPRCWDPEVWARPGQTRTYELFCQRVDNVEIADEPTATRFEGLVNATALKFRLTPDAGAPEEDSLTLRLTGPGGATDERVTIHNVPLSRNTPPRCDPASVAQRNSSGQPQPVSFNVACRDAEHDDYTLYGGGPGAFPDAPLHNDGGRSWQSVPSWRYVPTISAGQEQTTYYAIDALGARSADAPISVAVGPAVDRLPTCQPNAGGWGGADYLAIVARPGATRRFGVICEDPDGDPLTPRIQSPPSHGELTQFRAAPPSPVSPRTEVWVDVTYVPDEEYDGIDRFAIGADGPNGNGPLGPMAIVTRRLPANVGNGGCGWSGGGSVKPGGALEFWASCNNEEGDPMRGTVVSPPAHGTLDAPTSVSGAYGNSEITSIYRPDPGFEGSDAFSIEVSDGLGPAMTLDASVSVRQDDWAPPVIYTIGTPFDWPELHQQPTGATWQPAVGQAPPVTPLDQARRALRTKGVRLVKRIGDARFYAQRASLTASAKSRRALAVTCPVKCTVMSSGTIAGASAGGATLRVKPGRASALSLKLSAAQRTKVKRAGSAAAVFRLKVARAERKARRGTVKLAVRG